MQIVIPTDRPRRDLVLPDGRTLTLSPILKTDREFFEKALEELSLESRFLRFGQGISSLSERELDYLTDVDQRHHVAWGALVEDRAAGVGRYIVESGCAEIALTVLDSMQHQGVGRVLFQALVAVARADEVAELCFEAQPQNDAVLRLIGEVDLMPLVTDGVVAGRILVSSIPRGDDEAGWVSVIDEVRSSR